MEIFKLFGSILINSDEADRSLQRTGRQTESVGGKLVKGIGTAAKWGAAVGIAAAGAAISLGGVATGAAVKFEKQMANVATLLDGDVKSKIGNLGANVKKMATDTGTSTELLTDGLYQVVSAFGETDDAMKILAVANKGASAGNATVTDSVNLLSAVTKGYGDTSAEAAQQTSDLAFLTVKLGQTTFPELASSMGKVIPLAGAMKVKQEELFGAMATLTGVTGSTSEVTTQLRGTIQGFMKPTASMSTALKGMGFETGAAALESLGLDGALKGLKGSVGGNETALAGMFGSVEAGSAVLALTGAQAENFASKTLQMKDAAGATEAAFKTQQATVSAMMEKMKSSFNVVMITLGEKLLPMFTKLLDWVIKKMPQIQKFIDKAMTVVGNVLTGVANIITKVLIPMFKAIWDWVSPYLPKIKNAFETAFKAIKSAIQKAYDYIKPSFDNLVQVIKTSVMPIIMGLWDTVKKAMPGIKAIFKIAFPIIVKVVKTVIDIIAKVIKVVKGIYDFIKPGLDLVATIFSKTFGGIVDIIEKAWDWLHKWNKEPAEDKNISVTTTHYNQSRGASQFAIGSRYVPYDMTAQIHKGEMIVPKNENPYANSGKGRTMPTGESSNTSNDRPLVIALEVSGSEFGRVAINSINQITKREGRLALNI